MPNIGEKVCWFVYESLRFFLVYQIIFRLHILNSYDTMLFDKKSVQFASSGNTRRRYNLIRMEGIR